VSVDVICPTRGRPKYARDMAESCINLASGDVRVVLGVDLDDPCLEEYHKIDCVDLDVAVNAGGCVSVTNRLANNTDGSHVQFMGDDCLMVTEGWDKMLSVATYDDNMCVIYAKTLERSLRRLPYHPMLTREWIDAAGWFAPTNLRHYGMDTLIYRLAQDLGRVVWVDDVVINHRHYRRNNEGIPKDAVYEANEARVCDNRRLQSEADPAIQLAKGRIIGEMG